MPINPIDIGLQVVQENCFQEKFDVISGSDEKYEDTINSIDWTLSRKPDIGDQIMGINNHFVFKTEGDALISSFWILYRFIGGEETVYLVSIKPVEDGE